LKAYEGKEIAVGIRPERFESGGKFGDAFKANIEVVEMLGKEKTLFAKLKDGTDIVISAPGHYIYNEGEEHSFGFDINALHYFDLETTKRIN
jgi:multiple sugar transport system ATP-binding protein